MVYRPKPSSANAQPPTLDRWGRPERRPAEIVELLGKVESLLQESQTDNALKLIHRSKLNSPWVTNAMAVCLLRLNQAEKAVTLLRTLVLASGGLVFRTDVPTVFAANFVTALFACGNVEGGLNALHDIHDKDDPRVSQLLEAVARWKKSLSFWQRLHWYMGDQPSRLIELDCPLGNLD